MTDKLKAAGAWAEAHVVILAAVVLIVAGLLASLGTTLDAIGKANDAEAWHQKADSLARVVRVKEEAYAALRDTVDAETARRNAEAAVWESHSDSLARASEEWADQAEEAMAAAEFAHEHPDSAAADSVRATPVETAVTASALGPLPQVCVTPMRGAVERVQQLVADVRAARALVTKDSLLLADKDRELAAGDAARSALHVSLDSATARIAQLEQPKGRLAAIWDSVRGPMIFALGVAVGAKVAR